MSASRPRGYNERLFGGGIRTQLHLARFRWLARRAAAMDPPPRSVFELGCNDCRSIDWLPPSVCSYVGADAGWGGGLERARKRTFSNLAVELHRARTATELAHLSERRFDLVVSLETLEHIYPADLPAYLDLLTVVTQRRLLVSVPVEVGPVFLGKRLVKSLVPGLSGSSRYSLADVGWLTIGRAERVARDGHKGFDWRALVGELEARFTDLRISALPFGGPPMLGFQVAIEAEARRPGG